MTRPTHLNKYQFKHIYVIIPKAVKRDYAAPAALLAVILSFTAYSIITL